MTRKRKHLVYRFRGWNLCIPRSIASQDELADFTFAVDSGRLHGDYYVSRTGMIHWAIIGLKVTDFSATGTWPSQIFTIRDRLIEILEEKASAA